MKTPPTDIDSLPRRWRHLLPLTGRSASQVHTAYLLARRVLPDQPGRPWGLPLAVRMLLVLIHLRTNLTTARWPSCSPPANPRSIGSFTTWCRYWPKRCDRNPPSMAHRGSSTKP